MPDLLEIYRKFDESLKVSLYSELVASLNRFVINDEQIDLLMEITMKITKFEKFLEGLPHIFPLIYKHTDASKHEKYSTMIFEKLNSLVIRNAQGKSRFNEIDKVFLRLSTSGTDLPDLLNMKPFLNI